MLRIFAWICIAIALVGCEHTYSYVIAAGDVGPLSSGPVVRLTVNADQDYWPELTEDGTAVVYAFVDGTVSNEPQYRHRCIGLLPIEGGTRFWQACDVRPQLLDSLSSFPAFAVGGDGRLIYVESTSAAGHGIAPEETKLWLADTANPFRRRALLAFPALAGDSVVSWIADMRWTGANSFIALAQHYLPASHCIPPRNCPTLDSMFFGEGVVRGTITPSGASLNFVAGTDGASGYDLAEDGQSIVFSRRNFATLFKVPTTGGSPQAVATVTTDSGVQLLGFSCAAQTCVVATGHISPWAPVNPGPGNDFATIDAGANELRMVSLATGQSTPFASKSAILFSCPTLLTNGDVIVEVGLNMGHLQSNSSFSADLYLYKQ